ncbi:rCG53428 [Rattus norvegicus]|uniref:RCG53428 n=1 Tax=Rattus norvegicus TaxID=10116 RepID=A6JRI0_RAT|nr:rCG53428 [Rattus norvegicus]
MIGKSSVPSSMITASICRGVDRVLPGDSTGP